MITILNIDQNADQFLRQLVVWRGTSFRICQKSSGSRLMRRNSRKSIQRTLSCSIVKRGRMSNANFTKSKTRASNSSSSARLKSEIKTVSNFPAPSKNAKRLKIGRNELCPCGSGKKYKKCHGPLSHRG